MSTLLEFGMDVGGRNAYAPDPCTNLFSSTMTNGVAASVTVPKDCLSWIVSFSYEPGSAIWVDFSGATARLPTNNTFTSTTSELNPGARSIRTFENDGTTQNTISLITADANAGVSVSFYALPTGQ